MKIKLGFIGHTEMFDIFKNVPAAEDFELTFIDIKGDYNKHFDLDYVIIRGTNKNEDRVKKFISLNSHINYLDNLERFFSVGGKLKTSIDRFNQGVGPKTVRSFPVDLSYPIVAKPIKGKRCEGIVYLNSFLDYTDWKNSVNQEEYFFQEKLNLKNEFRVLVFNINNNMKFFTVKKKTVSGNRNLQQVVAPNRKLRAFLKTYRSWKTGIIGYDIGELYDGSFTIIEENRSPMFNRVERRLKINIPNELLTFIYQNHNF